MKLEKTDTLIYNLHEYGINPVSREIFLHPYFHNEPGSTFDDNPGMDYRMAATFVKNMQLLNQQGEGNILIHQISCGGDWNYGMAIYNAIKASVASVTILAYAHARSMSSLTLQAANRRVLMPDCDFVVHHGEICIDDRVRPMLSQAEYMKKVEIPRMIEIYANRCIGGKLSDASVAEEFILNKMQEKTDWILTAKEAVRFGFADGILGAKGYETIAKIRK